MHCASCARTIEKALRQEEGVSEASVNFAAETLSLEYNPEQVKEKELERVVRDSGYQLVWDKEAAGRDSQEKAARKAAERAAFSFLFTIPAFALMFLGLFGIHLPIARWLQVLIEALITFPVVFIAGYQTHRGALRAAGRGRANMDALISLGTFAAYGYGLSAFFFDVYTFFGLAAGIMAFHLLGRYLEARAKGKASEAIKKLLKLEAKTARILIDGQEKEVRLEEVKVGDIMVIRPGQKVPTDAEVISGISTIDESMATGESMPVIKAKGDELIGATINKQGALKAKATRVGKDTFLSQIIKMVEEAQGSKVPIQEFADKVTGYFVPAVIIIALLTFVGWFFVGGSAALTTAFFASIAVLVIACPCALGLATPTALMVGTGIGAEGGILIRNGEVVQTMRNLTAIVLDKTGTITKGKPEVTDIFPSAGFLKEKVLQLAASAEISSEHPLGEAIVNKAKQEGFKLDDLQDFSAITGYGVEARLKGERVLVGSRKLMEKEKVDFSQMKEFLVKLEDEAKTVVLAAYAGKAAGIIGVADTLKKDSKEAIKAFKEMGITPVMLTGDNARTAKAIAKKVGIEKVLAEVLPDKKVSEIQALQSAGHIVAMVGDGINDAPALKQANVGISIGTGTDIAIESSDLSLVRGELSGVVSGLKLSRFTFRTIKQNLFWAFIYNVVAIPVAALGYLNPIIAAGAMTISSISVIFNSTRLRKKDISLAAARV